MTTKIPFLLPCVFAANALMVVACAKAPSSRKTGPVPTPTAAMKPNNDDSSRVVNSTTPTLKLFSNLEVEKGTGKLYRCVEFKSQPTEAQEKQLRSRSVDSPESVESSSPDAACPTEGIKAFCLTEIQGVPGAYVKVNHGLNVDTPAKLADMKERCELNRSKWSETTAATGDPATEPADPKTDMTAPPGASPTAPAQANPAQTAAPATQKIITSTFNTFLSGVGAQSGVLCQLAAGTKITLMGAPTPSNSAIGQVEANMVKTDACLLEKATFVKSEWSGW
jgi:hypothetical protein